MPTEELIPEDAHSITWHGVKDYLESLGLISK